MRGETSTTKSGRRKWWRKFLRGGKANLSGSIRPWTDPLHSAADTCLSFRSPNCVDCLSTVSSSLPELLYIYFRRASLSLFLSADVSYSSASSVILSRYQSRLVSNWFRAIDNAHHFLPPFMFPGLPLSIYLLTSAPNGRYSCCPTHTKK